MFINIKDARKHYGEGETLVNALDGVSLSLNEGRIYVILGPVRHRGKVPFLI